MQRLTLFTAVSALALATLAPAQQATNPQAQRNRNQPAVQQRGELDELKYIVAMLDLTDEQEQNAEGLLDEYVYKINQRPDITQLTTLLQEFRDAQQAGDQEEIERVKRELEAAKPQAKARREFFTALRDMLTDEQQARLEQVLVVAERNPTGQLRPYDVLMVVKNDLKLSNEQHQKLLRVHKDFRERIAGNPRQMQNVPESNIPREFALAVRSILTVEQMETFDEKLAAFTVKPLNTEEAEEAADEMEAEEPAASEE
jgi:hypothetical protein